MTNKRSRFFTVIFSFLPGAGHMYMGFMKMGVSIMSAFFFVIFISSFLHLGPILYTLPILWFFSFFDCINKMSMSDENFRTLEDRYLFSIDSLFTQGKGVVQSYRLYVGIGLVLLGAGMLWNNLWSEISVYFNDAARNFIYSLNQSLPELIVGAVIIIIGARLIAGKKKEGR